MLQEATPVADSRPLRCPSATGVVSFKLFVAISNSRTPRIESVSADDLLQPILGEVRCCIVRIEVLRDVPGDVIEEHSAKLMLRDISDRSWP